MLKIKSNTNEFTIIFLRRLERKRMLKRSRSASVQFSTPSSFLLLFFFFSFLVNALSASAPLFLFSFGAPLFASESLPFLQPSLFLFFWCVAIFSAQNTFSAQKSLPVCGSAPLSFCFFSAHLFFFFSSCLSFLPLVTMYCPFSA